MHQASAGCKSYNSSSSHLLSSPHGITESLSGLRTFHGTSEHRQPRKGAILAMRSFTIKAVQDGRGRNRGEGPPQDCAGPLIKLKAIVTIRRKHYHDYKDTIQEELDRVSDAAGQKVILQLVSNTIDPVTRAGKRSKPSPLHDWADKAKCVADKVEYLAEFIINHAFGVPGAILVLNEHPHELYLETIALEGFPGGRIYFPCYSWVHSKRDCPERRVFFSNLPFLPQHTPHGIRDLREEDKASLQGTGGGVRKPHERVYDYDIYNDLGNPDKNASLIRPTLGNSERFPYPRRCRTGRTHTRADPLVESILGKESSYYVPRDETFEEIKKENFTLGTLKLIMHQLAPGLLKTITRVSNHEFTGFSDIDRLYKEGMVLKELDLPSEFFKRLWVPKFVNLLENSINLQYSQPQLFSKDRFSWLRDDTVGRQALAGINPLQIQLLKSFLPKSELNPEVYGPCESSIKAEQIERQLGGLTVEKAIEQKKLFILDYHDAFMPFINKINALDGHKMYASRSIFYLNTKGTFTPVAIELSLPPPSRGLPGRQRVFTPGQDATSHWFWQLAKVHAACNNAGYHQLVNHWLRTHAVVEPYVIATHRCLSFMHPICKLLHPHLRYTLEINALARQSLINAGGVIEKCFTPGSLSMSISAAAYKSIWRFDMESLPADLIRRGMAEEDPESPGGLRLLIEDYPYAADGLLIWDAIKTWVDEYVSLYYSNPQDLAGDNEIHEWWREIRECGHVDKKDEDWWPELRTKKDLIGILSTIIWITSAHHAAVNFGQYTYGGYVPNHPCMTRMLIPEQDEDCEEYKKLLQDPQKYFLSTISNRLQSTVVMSVLDSLSTHAPDEEYLGQRHQAKWTADADALAAASKFSSKMGVLPYELLRPTSGPGVTGRGVPNSISI
ncbi:hypothetical protein GOP47_0006200 [Adiantum capillus-veneris]|uniref:Lipoxygenase n=1 Tax=Adiantum capillus-veneris TaxID=13818 RepID=A0A9D4V2T6_ADICA|nr:hypothetical protein GOP47_0006200 [Adiantum capillus-veneris]